MEKEQQQLAALVRGKKVAFIGAGVSHRALIEEFVGLGAQVTLCDKKPSVEAFGDYAATIRRLDSRLISSARCHPARSIAACSCSRPPRKPRFTGSPSRPSRVRERPMK